MAIRWRSDESVDGMILGPPDGPDVGGMNFGAVGAIEDLAPGDRTFVAIVRLKEEQDKNVLVVKCTEPRL